MIYSSLGKPFNIVVSRITRVLLLTHRRQEKRDNVLKRIFVLLKPALYEMKKKKLKLK